jgi:RES domain-containing protein
MKLQRCWTLTRFPVQGIWYRAVEAQHASTPLASTHTARRAGRFQDGSPQRPGIEVIYLTDNPQVALYEVRAVIGSPLPGQDSAPNPNPRAWTIYPITVALQSVADLTLDAQLQSLDTSVQELTGDWFGYTLRPQHQNAPPPYFTHVPTQQLAITLHQTDLFEGLMSYSAVDPRHRNLIVFPAALQKGSSLACTDASGKPHQLPPAPRKPRKR